MLCLTFQVMFDFVPHASPDFFLSSLHAGKNLKFKHQSDVDVCMRFTWLRPKTSLHIGETLDFEMLVGGCGHSNSQKT